MAENGRQERSVLDDAKATFGKRWLAEAVRLSGEPSGAGINTRTDNPVAEQKARAAGGSAEHRILVWAGQIGTASGLADEIVMWRRRAWLIVLIIAGLALAGGFATAVAVLGDGSRAVNILWALGALLGLHLFMLVLWLLGMLARSDGALLGRLGFWLATRIKTRHAGALVQAFVALNARAGLTRWWLSLISHLVWLAALTGALAGLLFALALRSYVFVWETTILPESVFAQIVYLLSVVPDWLGLVVPDASTIGEASIISDVGVLQPDNIRRAWAGWLSGALLVYGIAPRALLALLCMSRIMWGIKRVRLNVKGSEWTMLVQRLIPQSEPAGVTDPAPASVPAALLRAPDYATTGSPAAVGFELSASVVWPPAGLSAESLSFRVDTRQERQQLLGELASHKPARLLLLCDATLSPDRGTMHWLAAAGSLAGSVRVCLLNTESAGQERIAVWQQSLQDIGLPASAIDLSAAYALQWLEHKS